MENLIIREILPNEIKAVHSLGVHAFKGFESLFVSKAKHAFVAVLDEQIVGAILYKFINVNHKKIGYIDYAYTSANHHGLGIGNALYKTTTDNLFEMGCDALTAVVKDDNVASWSLFMKNKFSRVSLIDIVQHFGVIGALKNYFLTPLCYGVGMEYYIASKEAIVSHSKNNSTRQLIAYFLVNFFVILIPLFLNPKDALSLGSAYLLLLLMNVIFEFIGSRFSLNRNWKFRLNNGGILVSLFINLFSIFPMIGNWYPSKYEKNKDFQKDMGITALTGWIALLFITVIAAFSGIDSTFIRILGQISVYFLIYKCIPFYPFESMGGRRVYNWNKVVYFIMFALSILIIINS